MSKTDSLQALAEEVKKFCEERDWSQFHTPKNVAIALTVEAAELVELFQWTDQPRVKEKVAAEAADILYMLLLFCQVAGIDLGPALIKKIKANAQKYPAGRVKGSPKKYDQY